MSCMEPVYVVLVPVVVYPTLIAYALKLVGKRGLQLLLSSHSSLSYSTKSTSFQWHVSE